MKTILVPIDYSPVSDNALNYATGLALETGAKLFLFHLYSIPVPNGEMPFVMVADMHDVENRDRLKVLEEKIRKKTMGKINVQSEALAGFNNVEEILNQVKQKKADLIVMGITGGTGKLAQALIGSTAISVLRKSERPVLIVPEKARFKKISKIVLACDYHNSLPRRMKTILEEIAGLHQGKLSVLNMQNPEEAMENEKGRSFKAIHKTLAKFEPAYFYEISEAFDSGIESFILKQKADLLVMIPHKHNLFDRLLHGSNTQRMAFHTSIPLLSIHD
jgi:nucleotide-binding universal stress UspA family protein